MDNQKYPVADIKALIGLGVAAIVALILLSILFFLFILNSGGGMDTYGFRSTDLQRAGLGTLGQEGGLCGGEKRLPCGPGLYCLLADKKDAEENVGVCAREEGDGQGATSSVKVTN